MRVKYMHIVLLIVLAGFLVLVVSGWYFSRALLDGMVLQSFDPTWSDSLAADLKRNFVVVLAVVFIGISTLTIFFTDHFILKPLKRVIGKKEPAPGGLFVSEADRLIQEVLAQHDREEVLEALVRERTKELISANQKQSELLLSLSNHSDSEVSKIGSEIHDELCAMQGVLKRRMEIYLRDNPGLDGEIQRAIQNWIATLIEIDQCARQIISRRRNAVAEYLGLEAGLRDSIDFARSISTQPISFIFSNQSDALEYVSPVLHYDILSIVRECIVNATKHSQASVIKLIVRDEPPNIVYIIKDDGIGMQKSNADQFTGGIGLGIIRERCEKKGFDFHIESGEGGTTVRLSHSIL
ncbi:MAG: hypothetical protein KDJ38_00085 [Gammaproteobacteria bacterium]|nr:hypothetical protein [Gammaproteobacteria bacterium]